MDKGFIQGRRHHLFRVNSGGFDEVAQHVVVLDLERGDPGIVGELCLHRRYDASPFVPQLPCLIQIFVKPRSYKTAISAQKRWFSDQRFVQKRDNLVMTAQRPVRIRQHLRQTVGLPVRDCLRLG